MSEPIYGLATIMGYDDNRKPRFFMRAAGVALSTVPGFVVLSSEGGWFEMYNANDIKEVYFRPGVMELPDDHEELEKLRAWLDPLRRELGNDNPERRN